jgi:uncharacterized protein (TIRG00374 family)
LLLGLALLPLAVRGISPGEIWTQLSKARPGYVLLSALTVLLTTAAKIVRWYTLFSGTERPSLRRLGQALLIGKSLNALLPARLGDLARIYVAGQTALVSRAAILGTLAAEKAFDTLLFLIAGSLAIVLVPLPPWINLPLVGGTAGGLLLFVLALAWPHRRIAAWFGRWAERLPWGLGKRLSGFLEQALSGLAALRQPGMALTAGLWSVSIWALAASTNALLFLAFDLDLSLGAALLLLVVLYAGVVPPTSPGRLGVFHTLTVLTLEALGINRVLGLAYAIVLHAIVYLPEILPGVILLALRLSAGQPAQAQTQVRVSDPPVSENKTTV